MKKSIIREKEGTIILVDILYYVSIIIVGYILLDFENYNIRDTLHFLPSLFYVLAFLSCVAYFSNRKRDYYEFLMSGLICVITGTYILLGKYDSGHTFIIGDAILIFAVANIISKAYLVKKLWEKKNINFIPKLVNVVLIGFISIFAVYSLYSKEDVAYMIIGYYIMGYGLISLLEPLTYIILNNPTVDKLLISFLKYGEKEEEKKPLRTLKPVNRKKIVYKEKEGSLVKKEQNINKNKKKKKL